MCDAISSDERVTINNSLSQTVKSGLGSFKQMTSVFRSVSKNVLYYFDWCFSENTIITPSISE